MLQCWLTRRSSGRLNRTMSREGGLGSGKMGSLMAPVCCDVGMHPSEALQQRKIASRVHQVYLLLISAIQMSGSWGKGIV